MSQLFPERTRKRFVTTVEMPRLLQGLEQEDNDHARHGIWLLLPMGLRSNELLKAKWEDIEWDMGTLFIGLTESGEPLLAPISDAAMDRLRVMPRISDNPYIICGRLPGQYLRSLGDPFRRALKRAGLVNLRIHDLRRTVGSWLAQDGRSLHLIGDVLNHRDPKTTAGYAYFQTQQASRRADRPRQSRAGAHAGSSAQAGGANGDLRQYAVTGRRKRAGHGDREQRRALPALF